MYWEAIAAYGAIFLVVGIALLFPLLWLVRRFVPEARRGPRVNKGTLVASVVGLVLAVAVIELVGYTGLVLFTVIVFALDFGVRRLRSKRENGESQDGI